MSKRTERRNEERKQANIANRNKVNEERKRKGLPPLKEKDS